MGAHPGLLGQQWRSQHWPTESQALYGGVGGRELNTEDSDWLVPCTVCQNVYLGLAQASTGGGVPTLFEASGILGMGHQAIWLKPLINDSTHIRAWVQDGGALGNPKKRVHHLR